MMKKILAFITSLSMCLSLLTAIAPALACEDDAAGVAIEERAELRNVDPEEEEEEILGDLEDFS